ncbi:orexin receptor type 2-like [Pecten maximus]|uniref:orexin receptor type 2-like n=1 Tax=Pecten maximus TaxID=6579 RepID=UPI001458AF9E|nr:orexin receptor type 2-like [Pecten maximus]
MMEVSTENQTMYISTQKLLTSSVKHVTDQTTTSMSILIDQTTYFSQDVHMNGTISENDNFMSNSEIAQKLLPVTIYIYILMCFGLLGNSVVAYVYIFTWKSTTVKYFIGYLATLDLITSGLCMPLEIVLYTNPITANSSDLCRILRFSRGVTSIAAGFMLIVIAVDRYLRVCKYTETQISTTLAKRLCILSLPVSLSISWPALFVFGNFDRRTPPDIILQTSCSTVQHLRGTIYPRLYFSMMFLIFVIVSTCLFFFYISVGIKLCRLRSKSKLSISNVMTEKCKQSQSGNCLPDLSTEVSRSNTLKNQDRNIRNPAVRKSSYVDLSKVSVNLKLMRRRSTRIMKSQKTSLTLFLITALEFIGFLPYVVLMMCTSFIPHFPGRLSESQQIWYNIGLLSYFLGNAFNPVIYGFFSGNFRRKCVEILQSVRNTKNERHTCSSVTDKRVSTSK